MLAFLEFEGIPNVYYTGISTARQRRVAWKATTGTSTAGSTWGRPRTRLAENDMTTRFGSAHPQGLHFVFCDGHVQLISYQIDMPTYQNLGVRNDGNPPDNMWNP